MVLQNEMEKVMNVCVRYGMDGTVERVDFGVVTWVKCGMQCFGHEENEFVKAVCEGRSAEAGGRVRPPVK